MTARFCKFVQYQLRLVMLSSYCLYFECGKLLLCVYVFNLSPILRSGTGSSEYMQGCQSSAFRRNSAFFSGLPLFFKSFSAFFEKSPKKKKKRVSDTAAIGKIRRASVNSH